MTDNRNDRDILIATATQVEVLQVQLQDWRREDRILKNDVCQRLSQVETWIAKKAGANGVTARQADRQYLELLDKQGQLEKCLSEQLPNIREAHEFVKDAKKLFWTALSAVVVSGANILLTLYMTIMRGG